MRDLHGKVVNFVIRRVNLIMAFKLRRTIREMNLYPSKCVKSEVE